MSSNAMGAVLAMVLAFSAPSAFGQNAQPAALAAGQAFSGELSPNDAQRRSGKYEDVFVVQGRRGARVDLRLGSEDFDSFLVVTGPEGFSLSNDDERERVARQPPGARIPRRRRLSRLGHHLPPGRDRRLPAAGFAAGGRRRRDRARARRSDRDRRRASTAALPRGTASSPSGEYSDRYRFTARRGQRVRAEAHRRQVRHLSDARAVPTAPRTTMTTR